MPEELGVDPPADLLERSTEHQRRHPGRELDDVDPTPHLATCLVERLPVLADHEGRELLEVPLEQRLEPEHEPCPLHDRHVRPLVGRLRGGARRGVHMLRIGERNPREPLAGRRIEHVEQLGAFHRGPAATDYVLQHRGLCDSAILRG